VAIELFQRGFLADLRGPLARFRPTQTFVDDVRRALVDKLFVPNPDGHAKISDYSGKAALSTWISIAALRTALNLRRRHRWHVSPEPACALEATALFDGPELEFLRAQYRDDFKAAISAAVARLSTRDRNLLRMHYLSGMKVEQLATIYRVHRVSVSRWLSASRSALVAEVERTLSRKLKLSSSQWRSLRRAMRSQLDVSLARLLTDAPARERGLGAVPD
jgi:RNA polymerase sigma-70 factor (ECF subfamily)